MTGQHSQLAPSSAAIRMQCPGSRKMMEQFPQDESSPKALEGEMAHLVAMNMLNTGEIMPGATEEMIEGAEMWCDAIRSLLFPVATYLTENRVDCSTLHPVCFGTPDLWSYNSASNTLHVADYKFGNRYVSEFENWQLLSYASGIVAGMPVYDKSTLVVHLTIVQPRCYHRDGPVRTWSINGRELEEYTVRLRENSHLAMTDDAPTITSPNCRDCTARHACQTLQNAAYSIVDMQGDNVPFDLPAAAIGRELATMREALGLLQARADGLENEVLARVRQGQSIPGWRTEQGVGREKWKVSIEEVVALGTMMGIDVSKHGVITPKQAIKKGISEEMVGMFTEVPTGEVKLVPDDGSKARRVFNKKQFL